MKKNIRDLIFLLVLFLVQTAALKVFTDAHVWFPSLTLVFLLVFTLKNSFVRSLWFSFAAGFLMELFSTGFFGSKIISYVLIVLTVYLITQKLTPKELNWSVSAFIIFLATLSFPMVGYVYNLILSLLSLTPSLSFGQFYTFGIFWKIIANLIVFYPINFIFTLLKNEKTF